MKKLTLIIFAIIGFNTISKAQKVFSADYASQADVKVYVVKYESQCDLKVYKVKYEAKLETTMANGFLQIMQVRQKRKFILLTMKVKQT